MDDGIISFPGCNCSFSSARILSLSSAHTIDVIIVGRPATRTRRPVFF
ncbi:MAG: hypothetical protein NTV68_07775 [Methanomicrobiales archaeon]|nr:hypothetical protein [Methanomicrobiales archaeon]